MENFIHIFSLPAQAISPMSNLLQAHLSPMLIFYDLFIIRLYLAVESLSFPSLVELVELAF
jgi:hypothetical protein